MFHRLLVGLTLVATCVSSAIATPQQKSGAAAKPAELTPQSKQTELTSDAINEQRKAVEQAELPEETKKQILADFDQAAAELTRAEEFRSSTASDEARTRTAKDTAADLEKRIEEASAEIPEDFATDWGRDQLQTELLTRTNAIGKLKIEKDELESEAGKIEARRQKLAEADASLATRRDAAQMQLDETPPENEVAMVSNARRLLARARLQALDAEKPAIVAEQSRLQAEVSFKVWTRRIELKQKQIDRYNAEQAAIKKRQESLAREKSFDLEYHLQVIPTETAAATEAADWVKRNRKLVATSIPNATRAETARTKQRDDDETTRKKVKGRVEQFDLIQPVGMELQEQLLKLRDTRELEVSVANREEESVQLKFELQAHNEKLEELKRRLETVQVEDRFVLESRIAILTELTRNETSYIDALRMLNISERQLISDTEEYRQWLRERVLWIRSNRVLGLEDVSRGVSTLGWLCSAESWLAVPMALYEDALNHSLLYIAVVALVTTLLLLRSRSRRNLTKFGQRAKGVRCATYRPTIRAMAVTVMLAIPWPLLAVFIGLRLRDAPMASDFVRSVGMGFEAAGIAFLLMQLLKQACRNDGLGESHFLWTDSAIRSVRLGLRNLIIVLLPLLFVATVLHNARTAPGQDSLERICFVLGLAVIAAFCYRLLHPKRGIFAAALNDEHVGWGQRTVWVWYPLAIGIPLVLAGLVVVGYFFTAYELTWRLAGTICLVTACVVLQALLVRWNLVQQRKLQRQQSLLRAQAVRECDAEAEALVEEEQQTITTVSEQTHRLINTGLVLVGLVGLWALWSQVLPAVSFVTQKELWKTARQVSVEKVVDGTPTVITETMLEPITPLSLLKAVFLIIATITAARNLPGLLEIMVLQRLPLEPALRYALRTVARYLIVIAGLTAACSMIGIGWSKVQWLVAGLTVGLGFGLQEIFANFVSGLIILFERPVRLGDVVTIDDVSGTVSRIQIRATTITDWDRKEYIVPNKELVTGRVLNWTLSDSTSRIVIEVGVAYGTDTNVARKLLIETAAAHPLVLDDPGPIATFEKFGDSTLNLILRCYMPSLDGRLDTISELHTAIHESFTEAKIEIAFPQLDVNLNQSA